MLFALPPASNIWLHVRPKVIILLYIEPNFGCLSTTLGCTTLPWEISSQIILGQNNFAITFIYYNIAWEKQVHALDEV